MVDAIHLDESSAPLSGEQTRDLPRDDKLFKSPERFINREISWNVYAVFGDSLPWIWG